MSGKETIAGGTSTEAGGANATAGGTKAALGGANATAGGAFAAAIRRNPAWIQLLGLCPLLAVSNSLVNAIGLALASGFVLVGSALAISTLRSWIPNRVRLPCFVLVIATFTTVSVLLLEAYAFELYLRVALFVQIIVSNCMILGRMEAFASRQPPWRACMDALGTAAGFAIALIALGGVREAVGQGSLLAGMEHLFGAGAAAWRIDLGFGNAPLLIALLPPGAFLVAGLLLGLGNGLRNRLSPESPPGTDFDEQGKTNPDLRKAES